MRLHALVDNLETARIAVEGAEAEELEEAREQAAEKVG